MRTTQYTRNRGVIVERCAAKREDLGSPQGSCICTLHDVVFFPGRMVIVARAQVHHPHRVRSDLGRVTDKVELILSDH